jgi:hypothetical protein
MIYRFTGSPESNEVKLMDKDRLQAICLKGQVLVNPNSDYKTCEITQLSGQEVKSGN